MNRRAVSLPAWLAAYGLPLAAAGIGVVAGIQTILAIQFGLRPETNPSDFFYFYRSAQEIHNGGDWYGGTGRILSLNSPAVALLYAPLARFAYSPAYLLWTTLSVVALVGMCVRVAGASRQARAFWLVVLVLTTISGMMNIAMGQLGFPLAWLVTEAWLADRDGRPVVAGMAIGVAVYAKVFLGLLLVYLLWRRAWRTFGASLIGFALVALVGLAAGGWPAHQSWLRAIGGITWLENPLNASIAGVLERTLQSPAWWLTASLDAVAVLALALGIRRADDVDRSWALVLFGSLLLSPLGWMYYIPMALGPLATLWDRGSPSARALIVMGTLLLCVHPPESGSALHNFTRGSVYAWSVLLFSLASFAKARDSSGREVTKGRAEGLLRRSPASELA